MRAESFRKRLSEGPPLILDGALGTELERWGIDTSGRAWTSQAILSHPDTIQQIHEAYLERGSDIITANTFRTGVRAQDGNVHKAKKLTHEAVQIAKRAAIKFPDKEVFVAGSIAPAEDCFSPELVPASDDELFKEHQQLANWLVESQVDCILIETMNTFREAYIALNAVRSVTELPVLLSLVPLDGTQLLSRIPINAALNTFAKLHPDALLFNCAPISTVKLAMPTLANVAVAHHIPFGAYPNASELLANGEWNLTAASDAMFAEAAREWISEGASVIGSCCGSTPSTIAELCKCCEMQ